jgi:hypothetical protein
MKYSNRCFQFFVFCLSVFLACSAQAAKLEKFVASATTIAPGGQVTFTVAIKREFDRDVCGAAIDVNSSREHLIRFGLNPNDHEQTVQITFPEPGNYAVTLKGRPMIRGLNSVVACDGQRSMVIVVQAAKPSPVVAASEPVTARIPQRLAPAVDQTRYMELMAINPQFKQAIDLFTAQKPEAMGLLTLLSEMGEPYAQLFLGLTYEKEWSKASNLRMACHWIRKSAEAGISQARLFLANRALNKSRCFDVEPTLEEADVWVKLAAMSNDVTIRNEARALEESILKIRLGVK